ncbi:hypothetical protein [Paraburkholderia ferrariae]|jgi:hypothetical protein|uniref:hypothetical protein n=1 Tax=Paraburkholderia ferrariae TaxID=386056 RepID=UPI0012EB233E|nr:hypothetical protein [Paraburkholderia ferrariae]
MRDYECLDVAGARWFEGLAPRTCGQRLLCATRTELARVRERRVRVFGRNEMVLFAMRLSGRRSGPGSKAAWRLDLRSVDRNEAGEDARHCAAENCYWSLRTPPMPFFWH